jgi:uncharacterized protein (TIGR00725 family)
MGRAASRSPTRLPAAKARREAADAPRYVGVIGGRDCTPEEARLAYELGQGIAREGWVLVCGGMGGIMEQACRGAHEAGGVSLGILFGNSREEGNPYLSYSIVTGMGEARNVLVVKSCHVVVAVAGAFGTLSEIALANNAGIPVIGLRSWRIDPAQNRGRCVYWREADTAEQAVHQVREYFADPRA